MSEYVGRKVLKTFPGHGKRKFAGKVASYNPSLKQYPWHVKYADGDEEDISLAELKKILADQPSGAGPPKARKTTPRAAKAPATQKATPTKRKQDKPADAGKRAPKRAAGEASGAAESGVITRMRPSTGGLPGNARYNQCVVHAGTCYLAGQTATDTAAAGADTYAVQAKQVFAAIDSLLKSAGTSKQRLLTALVHLKDIRQGAADFNAAWEAWADQANLPARTTVHAPMMRDEFLVEVTVTAAMP